ncbi:MAG: T9SS type A sorting domain-containing protein [Saprospiraceae bacterium]|nr:T9SS type A sorting domain-containing protein [Saprospiraceae bacterium]
MMKYLLYPFLFLFFSFHLQSQEISQCLIGAGGTESSKSPVSLDWSLGQILNTSVKTHDGLLTQGYLQPMIPLIKPDNDSAVKTASLDLFPNPASAQVNVTVSFESDKMVSLALYNIYGSPCQTIQNIQSGSEKQLDLKAYPSGTYFILLYDSSGRMINKTHFIKI